MIFRPEEQTLPIQVIFWVSVGLFLVGFVGLAASNALLIWRTKVLQTLPEEMASHGENEIGSTGLSILSMMLIAAIVWRGITL